MGFFDKLFGRNKKNNDTEIKSVEAENKAEETVEKCESEAVKEVMEVKADIAEHVDEKAEKELLKPEEKEEKQTEKQPDEKIKPAVEMFAVSKDALSVARRAEICTRFVNNALSTGQELKSSDLCALNYAELCVIYNNYNWFLINADEKVKSIAKPVIDNNKKVVRAELLKKLKGMTLYTLYTKLSNLPFVNNGALYIFTDKNGVENQVNNSELKYLYAREIPEKLYEQAFGEFFCLGYKGVIIDMACRVELSELYKPTDVKAYGVINPAACSKMIFFNQMTEAFSAKARSESRKLSEEESKNISKVWADITNTLIRSVLLVPAEKETVEVNGENKDRIKAKIPVIGLPDGSKWLAMFTDQGAVNLFHKRAEPSAGMQNLIIPNMAKIKNDPNVTGIIINPGRESFKIHKSAISIKKKEENGENPPKSN